MEVRGPREMTEVRSWVRRPDWSRQALLSRPLTGLLPVTQWSLLTGFSISDLRDPSPSQILRTSSRFSGGLLLAERETPRELLLHSSTSSTF